MSHSPSLSVFCSSFFHSCVSLFLVNFYDVYPFTPPVTMFSLRKPYPFKCFIPSIHLFSFISILFFVSFPHPTPSIFCCGMCSKNGFHQSPTKWLPQCCPCKIWTVAGSLVGCGWLLCNHKICRCNSTTITTASPVPPNSAAATAGTIHCYYMVLMRYPLMVHSSGPVQSP